MLAMQAANSTNSNDFKSKVMDVANSNLYVWCTNDTLTLGI